MFDLKALFLYQFLSSLFWLQLRKNKVSLQWEITTFAIALALCTLQRKEPTNGQVFRCSFQSLVVWGKMNSLPSQAICMPGLSYWLSGSALHKEFQYKKPIPSLCFWSSISGRCQETGTDAGNVVSEEPQWWFEYTQRWERDQKGGSSQACRPLLKKIIYRYITATSHDDNTKVND